MHSSHTGGASGAGARPYHTHHLPAENVLVSIGWWLVENPMLGGVLRVCRLKLPSAASTSTTSAANSGARSTAQFQHVAPLPITTAALILDEKEPTATSSRRAEQKKATESCNCALCGFASVKHWSDEDLTETEKALFIGLSSTSTPIDSQSNHASSRQTETITKTAEKRERPPPKKKEARRDSDPNLAESVEKKQKLSHQSQQRVSSQSSATPEEPHSRDTSFTASSPTEGEGEDEHAASGSESDLVDISNETEGDHRASPAHERPPVSKKSSRPPAHPSTASAEPNTAKELRQELDRLRVENRRLKDDTDLTMRKADRRFEMEMAARRLWKQQKNQLEGVISQLQKDQQRFAAEREKVKRVHGLLQSVLETASDTLQYTDDATDAAAQGRARRSAIPIDAELQSPASKFQSDLAEVAQAHGSAAFAGAAGSSSRGRNAKSWSKRAEDGAQQANFARKPFFCIVCLEHTARVAIQPCGHICFCPDHAQEMERRGHDHNSTKCPLCQAKIESFLTIQGIDA